MNYKLRLQSWVFDLFIVSRNFVPNVSRDNVIGACHGSEKLNFYCFLVCSKILNKRKETELSKYIWTLKDNNKPFTIKWRIIKQRRPYSNISNKCNLCLFEKFVIICKKSLCTLNKRKELASACPHRNRYLLKNFVTK